MTDWMEVAKTVSGPLAGAITGLAGSLLGLKKRMDSLEKKVARHTTTIQGHGTLFANVDEEFEKLRNDMKESYEKYDHFMNSIRNSNQDFAKDAELANFMTEQQLQWQTFERTLGRIEGHLGLGPQPHPTVPRPQPRQSNPRTPPPFPSGPRTPPPFPMSPNPPKRKP